MPLKEIDVYDVIDPVLMRPAMYFGRPSITDFYNFYFGLQYLGGCGHGGPTMYKLKNDLWSEDGFFDWVYEKYEWSKNVVITHLYRAKAEEQLNSQLKVAHRIESVAFDLFHDDLKEFRALNA